MDYAHLLCMDFKDCACMDVMYYGLCVLFEFMDFMDLLACMDFDYCFTMTYVLFSWTCWLYIAQLHDSILL